MLLLDTNVISEAMHVNASPRVLAWLDDCPAGVLCASAYSVYEVHFGLSVMPTGKRQRLLRESFETLMGGLVRNRVLPVDATIARHAAHLAGVARRAGRPVGGDNDSGDLLIAATAAKHGATLVTRNSRHFQDANVTLVNPWED